MAKQNKVCVNIDQSDESNGGFSDAEKARARTNIGAGDGKIPWVTMGGQTPVVVRSGLSIVKYQAGYCLQNDDASVKLWLAPDFVAGDAGKILGIGSGGAIGWRNAPRELPSATQQDAGKALILDENGQPIWYKCKPVVKASMYFHDIQVNWTYSGTSSNYSKAAITIENLEPNKMHRINIGFTYRQNYSGGYLFAYHQESNIYVPAGNGRYSIRMGAYDSEYNRYIVDASWDLVSSDEGKLFINIVGDADSQNRTNKVYVESGHYQVVQTEL